MRSLFILIIFDNADCSTIKDRTRVYIGINSYEIRFVGVLPFLSVQYAVFSVIKFIFFFKLAKSHHSQLLSILVFVVKFLFFLHVKLF
jgi:hypothetical protein